MLVKELGKYVVGLVSLLDFIVHGARWLLGVTYFVVIFSVSQYPWWKGLENNLNFLPSGNTMSAVLGVVKNKVKTVEVKLLLRDICRKKYGADVTP